MKDGKAGFPKLAAGGFILLLICVLAGWIWRQGSPPAQDAPSGTSRIPSAHGGSNGNNDGGPKGKFRERTGGGNGVKMSVEEVISQISSGRLKPEGAGRINVDEALEIVRRTNLEVRNVDERSRVSSLVIGLLGNQGDAEAAWSLIEPGPGLVRSSNLAAFFSCEGEPVDKQVGRLSQLANPKDYTSALNKLTFARPQEVSKMLADGKMVIGKSDMSSLIVGLTAATYNDGSLAGDRAGAREVLQNMSSMVSKGTMSADQFASLMTEGSFGNGFDQWEALKALGNPGATARSQDSVIRNMMMTDARQAMEMIMADGKAKASASAWNATMNSLYEVDTDYANQWVEENLSKVDAPTSQHIIASLARVALRDKDFPTVEKWVGHVSDGKVREDLLRELDKQRKKAQPPATQ